MKIVPEKSYEVTTRFDPMSLRWKARFESIATGMSAEFPLPDQPLYGSGPIVYINRGEGVTLAEETILALVFQNLVSSAAALAASRAILGSPGPKGEAGSALTE